MLTLEKLYESVFEHITDRDFVRFIEEPEEVELLSEKDCKLIKKGGSNGQSKADSVTL
jgi:hypothetical protein